MRAVKPCMVHRSVHTGGEVQPSRWYEMNTMQFCNFMIGKAGSEDNVRAGRGRG